MQRFRKTLRPASRVWASAISPRAAARTKAGVTGGADFRLVSQLARMTAHIGPMITTRRSFISKRESEDCPHLEIWLVPSPGDLAQRRQRCPASAMSDRNVRARKKFAGLRLRPIRESNFVDKLRAEKKARIDFVAQT